MEEIQTNIAEQVALFVKEADKQLSGNKSAGRRARKAALELEKLFKRYRKLSIEISKR